MTAHACLLQSLSYPEMSMLYLIYPTDQDISEDPVKELRKAQGPLLDGLQSLWDQVTETGSQSLVIAKLIRHRKGKP